MEAGVIFAADETQQGLITPDAGGERVLFDSQAFDQPWSQAVPGRAVKFSRKPGDQGRASKVTIA